MTNNLSYILYVEDDELEVMRFQIALRSSSFEGKVEVTINGEEALAFLNEHRHHLPSLIILDLRMPVMDGFELLNLIKSDISLRRIPIIVFSTSENETDIIKSYDFQVAGYFTKPFGHKEYNKIIERMTNYWKEAKVIS